MVKTGGARFFATEETERLEIEPGYWVELKLGLDYGEESELEGAAVRMGVDVDRMTKTATPRVAYSIRDQRILMLALYIVDWNFVNARGRTVPIPDQLQARQDLFARMDRRTATRIIERIEEIRRADNEPDVISLEGLEPQEGEAELDPTTRGDETETRWGPSSPDISDVVGSKYRVPPSESSERSWR